jgi:hypothetical protein
MPFVDVNSLRVTERLPGWHGRYFHTPNRTFAHYDFVRGSSIHEHFHAQEEVYEVIGVDHRRRGPDRPAGDGRHRTGRRPPFRQGSHRRTGNHRRRSSETRVQVAVRETGTEALGKLALAVAGVMVPEDTMNLVAVGTVSAQRPFIEQPLDTAIQTNPVTASA